MVLDTAVAREVLGDAARYVAAAEGHLVADALGDALGPGDERARLLRAAPSILARYDWRRTAQATLAVLEQAAGA